MLRRLSVGMLAFLLPLKLHADTIPCDHRFAEAKARDLFKFVQQKPEVNTGVTASRLVEIQEVRQARLEDHGMLVRYCGGILLLDNGDRLKIHYRLGSRDTYKSDRAEDIQICWRNTKYGVVDVPDQSLGCSEH